MKIAYINSLLLTVTVSLLIGCNSSSSSSDKPTNETGNSIELPEQTLALGISKVPDTLANTYTKALSFDRYTKVDTPNGGAIHIVAQNQITDNQIYRARSILEHFLAPLPGSEYGEDKTAVANKMSENGATLMLLNGVDDGTNGASELDGQPLYYGEMQVEGHQWYITQNYEHRDASYEEILHLVHDYGIGVDQGEAFYGALPQYQADIRAAQVIALSGKLWAWHADQADWIAELTAENSLSQEYLASVIDTYYGLWGAFDSPYGMWGMYIAKIRDDLASKDPQGWTVMDNKFFHPYLTYNARIDESFEGDFSLRYNATLPYSHHSQYLKDITLTGANSNNVVVNQLDNNITGNSAENTVIFSGPSSEYQITNEGEHVIVQDMRDNRDGTNTITAVEKMKFTDTTIDTPTSN